MGKSLLKLPPLDAIRGFVAVARRMSITQAAQDLCLTQSAVSRQIQTLEAHLGSPLFVRKHRTLELTAAGEQLLQLASPWFVRLGDYCDAVRQHGQMHPVTITAPISVTSLWLLPRLGEFQNTHPNIDVRVAANNRVLDLQRENIDMAIRYARASDVPEHAICLFHEKVQPMANKKVAERAFANPAMLLNEVLLEFDERPLPWLRWANWLNAFGLPDAKPRAYLHLSQYDQVIHAAMAGHGVALGRVALVQPMLDDGRLVALSSADPTHGDSDYAYWLVDESGNAHIEAQIFRDWIIQQGAQCGKLLHQQTLSR